MHKNNHGTTPGWPIGRKPFFPSLKRALRLARQNLLWRVVEPRSENVLITINGVDLRIPRRFLHHYVRSEYEPLTQRMFAKSIQPGMVVIDVGAHIGYYTLRAAIRTGPWGQVHSIEPSPDNLAYLRENISLNNLTNVAVAPCAAGAIRERRTFHLTGSSDSHSFYSHPLTATVQTLEIEQVPLDELVQGAVDVVKIDAEGAEIGIIRGMRRILEQSLELYIEWNPACLRSAGEDPCSLPDLLHEVGFGVIRVIDDRVRKITALADVIPRVRAADTPEDWYVNLWASK